MSNLKKYEHFNQLVHFGILSFYKLIISINYPIFCNMKLCTETLFCCYLRLPYDVTQPHVYAMDCCLMVFVLSFFCCSTTGVDTLYGWCALGVSLQYRRLGQQLKRIPSCFNPSRSDFGLSGIFVEHARLLKIVQHFNYSFMEIAFVEVVIICGLYCSVICQYIMPHTNQNFAFLGFFSLVVTTQLCIYLFGAEQVRLEAERFSRLLYEVIPWQNLPPKHRKLFLFPIERAQRETVLGAYFFELGRPLLVWVSIFLFIVLLF